MTSSASIVKESPSTGKTSCQIRRAEAKAKVQLALADTYVRKANASNGRRAGLLMRRANTIRTIEADAVRARAAR